MQNYASRLHSHNQIYILDAYSISVWMLIMRMYILPRYAIERTKETRTMTTNSSANIFPKIQKLGVWSCEIFYEDG
jgi:hypothetical protein